MAHRIIVKVTAEFDPEGRVRPLAVTWGDGQVLGVDRVSDERRVVSLKQGGAGMRYTCLIGGRTVYLFFEEPCWFMERKEA